MFQAFVVTTIWSVHQPIAEGATWTCALCPSIGDGKPCEDNHGHQGFLMILEHLEEQLPVGACTAVIVTFLSLFSAQTVKRLGCGILSALLVISTTGWVIFKLLTWPDKVTLEIREKDNLLPFLFIILGCLPRCQILDW